MQNHYRLSAWPGLLLIALTPAVATGSDLGEKLAQKGNDNGATACVTCHGAEGAGNGPAGWPRLAGMNADHLVKQLDDMASGERDNATMNPIASGLTTEERRAVSEYYAEMEAPAEAPGTDAAESVLERGRAIAEQGLWRKGFPPASPVMDPVVTAWVPISPASPASTRATSRTSSPRGRTATAKTTPMNSWPRWPNA